MRVWRQSKEQSFSTILVVHEIQQKTQRYRVTSSIILGLSLALHSNSNSNSKIIQNLFKRTKKPTFFFLRVLILCLRSEISAEGTQKMERSSMFSAVMVFVSLILGLASAHINGLGEQSLSKIAIYKATLARSESSSIKAHPSLLGLAVQLLYTMLVSKESKLSIGIWFCLCYCCPDYWGFHKMPSFFLSCYILYQTHNTKYRRYDLTGRKKLFYS